MALMAARRWPLMVLLPAALVWGIFSRHKMAQISAWFFLLAYLVFGTSPVLLSRYMTPLLPVAALLLGAAVVLGVERFVRAGAARVLLLSALAIGMLLPSGVTFSAHPR